MGIGIVEMGIGLFWDVGWELVHGIVVLGVPWIGLDWAHLIIWAVVVVGICDYSS